MRVINIHKRTLNQPIEIVSQLFKTLGTQDDKIWPNKSWPPMRFKEELKVGAKGGHAGIKYTIIKFVEGEQVIFKFTKPVGFIGTHELKIKPIDNNKTEITHEINMNSTKMDTLHWVLIVRWLHDALIEDAFDKIENHYSENKKETKYNLWVKFLRSFYKMKSAQTKYA